MGERGGGSKETNSLCSCSVYSISRRRYCSSLLLVATKFDCLMMLFHSIVVFVEIIIIICSGALIGYISFLQSVLFSFTS